MDSTERPTDGGQVPRDRMSALPSTESNISNPGVGHWNAAPAARPAPRPMSVAAQRVVLGLVVFSFVFLAFAGGMLFQRFVIGEDAEASTGGAPETFDTAWNLVQTRYVDTDAIDEDAMLEAAIDGMLQTLKDEGHTRYLTAEESRSESESLQGEYVGVGIQVNERDDQIVVVAPIDQSPAKEAGVLAGDVLIAVDGVDVTGQSIDEVIQKVRGEAGSQVTLRFLRDGEDSPLTFTLTRRKIDVSSVAWTMLDGDIADIRLTQFTAGAGDDLAIALEEAKAAGAKGIILDLRNNPGGYINEAIQIGSMFVPEGETIFITQVRDGSQEPHLATPQPHHVGDLPLVVLINRGFSVVFGDRVRCSEVEQPKCDPSSAKQPSGLEPFLATSGWVMDQACCSALSCGSRQRETSLRIRGFALTLSWVCPMDSSPSRQSTTLTIASKKSTTINSSGRPRHRERAGRRSAPDRRGCHRHERSSSVDALCDGAACDAVVPRA